MSTTPKYQKWSANFTKLNNEFSSIQNASLTLRNSDGDFADPKRIAIKKRKGTAQHGQQLSASGKVNAQFYYKNNAQDYHLVEHGTVLYKKAVGVLTATSAIGATTLNVGSAAAFDASGSGTINGDTFTYTGKTGTSLTGVTGLLVAHNIGDEAVAWVSLVTGLTNAKATGIAMQSYSGATVTTGTAERSMTGTWSAVASYTAASTTTTFTNASASFPADDSIIGWFVFPNQTDGPYKGNSYRILAHTATTIVVSGDLSAGTYSGKTYKIEPADRSQILIDQGQSWTKDAYTGNSVVITSGTGVGQSRLIASNDSQFLTVGFPWDIDPDGTSQFAIYSKSNVDNVLFWGNGTDDLKRYDGTSTVSLTGRPKGNIVDAFGSRLIVTGSTSNPHSVYYSQVANPEYFDPTFIITPKGFDIVKGHAVWQDKGIIFKENSIWAYQFVYNSTTNVYDVSLDEVPTARGCINQESICKVQNEIWYYDGFEVQSLGAAENQIGVIRTKSVSFPINALLQNLTPEQAATAVMSTDGIMVRFCIPGASLFFEYDTRYNTWMTRTGAMYSVITVDAKKRWFCGRYDSGNVEQLDIANHYSDLGTPGLAATGGNAITWKVMTKGLDMGGRALYKNYRYIDFFFENAVSSFVYSIKLHTAFNMLDHTKELAIGYGGTVPLGDFGTAEWAEMTNGGTNPQSNTFTRRVSVSPESATFATVEANNSVVDQNLTLIGIDVTWKPRSMKHYPDSLIS